jgi:hypothetical protein
MKNSIALLILLFLCSALSAQQSETVYVKSRDKEALYLKYEKNAAVKNSRMTEMNTPVYANRENAVNVYINWLNPLKYKVTWKDTVIVDERDVLVRDFLAGLVDQFNFKSTEKLKVAEAPKLPSDMKAENIEGNGSSPPLYLFKDPSLLAMSIFVYMQPEISTDGLKIYSKLLDQLSTLETLESEDFSNKCTSVFLKLLHAETSDQMLKNITKCEKDKSEVSAKIDSVDLTVGSIKGLLETFKILDTLLSPFIDQQVSNYINKVNSKNLKWKQSVEKLDKIIDICDKSLLNPSPSVSDSYFLQTVEFENGKQLEAEIKIVQYEYDTVSMTVSSEKVVATQKYKFMKYDCVDVFVSAGFFYASSDIPAFGVSGDSASGFTVERQNLLKNTAIPATFLNLSFNVSRYFSPLIQLGVDPTKKRPYLLLGTGFSIPAARFSISAGPFWTWVPTLNKLEEGGRIASTLDLEKDIKYSFDVVPRGWYLGIQYNFK